MAISIPLPKNWIREMDRDSYRNVKTGERVLASELAMSRSGDLDDIVLRRKENEMKEKKQAQELKKKLQTPNKVRNFKCAKCGELLLRIYPWANVQINEDAKMICKKCG